MPVIYSSPMADIGKLLANNLRRIRKKTGCTQEEFAERLGIMQGRLSDLENAKGWKQISGFADKLELAGIDPLELFQHGSQPTVEEAELLELIRSSDPVTRSAILALLRNKAALAAS